MMKKIEKDLLEHWKREYQEEKSNTILRHALGKSKLSDVVRVGEEEKKINFHFSLNLDTLPVTDQMASGRCWIFAGCNIIREKVAKKYNIPDFELSQNYISFYDKLEKANYFMETIASLPFQEKDDRVLHHFLLGGIEDGGQWDMFVNIVNKYGVVPKQAMPETYQSSHTTEVNRLINRKLRQFAAYVLEKRENIEALKKETEKEIYHILMDAFGVPPEEFDFEYTDKENQYHVMESLTPLCFYQEYCDIDLNDFVSVIHAPTSDKPFGKTFTVDHLGNVMEGKKILYLNLEMDRVKELVLKQLQNLEPVWFGSDCNQFFDRKEGIFHDLAFDYETAFGMNFNMTKEERLDTLESMMNHAMVITGANVKDGEVERFKIENSWGDEVGKKGYYVASASWFEKFVYQVIIHKKYLNNEEKKALEEKPIILKPWDPMGTLA